METYLVEIVRRTSRGAGQLIRHKVEAGSSSHAYNIVLTITGVHCADVLDAYITSDPYKVDRV